jgi:uncharacterized iron-regulated membrane protein
MSDARQDAAYESQYEKIGDVTARSFRQTLQTVHLWAGLILALPMIVIGLSGSALLVQREILFLSIPAASAAGEPQTIARMVQAAQTAMAPNLNANWVALPQSAGKPASVQFIVSNRPQRSVEVLVDPVSLQVLGTSEIVRRGPVRDVLVNIHGFLMMPSPFGLALVGWVAVAMSFMGLSGLFLWWPRNGRWKAAFLVRRGARGLRLHLDLHHAVGIWGMMLFLTLSISGLYLAFPQTVSEAVRMALPTRTTEEAGPRDLPRIAPANPDQAIAIANSAVPDARATAVQLPGARRPMVVQMEPTGFSPATPPVTVIFDSNNAERISIDDPRRYPVADRVLNFAYALHFSLGMGGLWTFLVFLSGFLPLVLAVTGTTIWWKKRQAVRSH